MISGWRHIRPLYRYAFAEKVVYKPHPYSPWFYLVGTSLSERLMLASLINLRELAPRMWIDPMWIMGLPGAESTPILVGGTT